MSPGPAVCLYPDVEDEFISRTIRSSGLWEPRILNDTFRKILSDDAELGVIDIGANIGVYSLVSAAMGHDVIAVEPFNGHLRRFHKAINLGMCMRVRVRECGCFGDMPSISLLKFMVGAYAEVHRPNLFCDKS